ncbi:MAG: hypothetical protein JSV03_09335 [Planctomycetota bacterium]|nr:MAG: hypothetical protein JSV03_09335 [Planctomycetota bacterium]
MNNVTRCLLARSLTCFCILLLGIFGHRTTCKAEGIIQRNWQQVISAGLASEDKDDLSLWTVVDRPPGGKGLSIEPGPMIYAGTYHTADPFFYDPTLTGWHRIYIGFYLPKNITYTGVAAKLDHEISYTCVADPRASLADRGKKWKSFLDADFVEVEFKAADLTSRRIIIYHPQGCWSYITHFRFVPLAASEIVVEKAGKNKKPFDVHLWQDYMDQLELVQRPEKDWWHNSPKAIHRYIRYFCDYGCNSLGHRFMAGGSARYNSGILRGERARYIDKLVGPDIRDPWASYRFGDIETDVLSEWVKWCHFYGKKAFAVWCFEDAHGYTSFLSFFNVEHPQFMGKRKDGTFALAYASLAYPEVIEHKLAIAQEVLDRGVDGFVFDFQRVWGWFSERSLTYHHRGMGGWDREYVPHVVEAYKHEYGVDPRTEPDNNRRWIEFCARYHTNFFREFRKCIDAFEQTSGRTIEIVMAIPAVSEDPFTSVKAYGCDWETWVDEGLMTAMSPIIPAEDINGGKQTLDDLVDIMEYVHAKCKGKCEVVWPLAQYKRTLTALAKNSGYSLPDDINDVIDRILKEAYDHGAAGIQLTTVDYNMVDPKISMTVDAVVRYYKGLNGPYRWRK